jgi:GNAT superfamily N-acetyltransferase
MGLRRQLHVRAADRDRGIGRRLLETVVDEARRRSYERLVVNPSEESAPLYRRAGFAGADTLLLLQLSRGGNMSRRHLAPLLAAAYRYAA